jgi:hypothetical protein
MSTEIASMAEAVRKAVGSTVITDIHTHLFPPSHGKLLLWGADEMLTYHYLVAELFTVAPPGLTCQKFWSLPKPKQADLVWEHVFLRHGALSEAARGVITTFNKLGLDVAGRDLDGIRKWFAAQKVEDYLARVFQTANIDSAVMTNNPFNPQEAAYLNRDLPCPDCLKPALRIDPLLVDFKSAVKTMKDAGCKVQLRPTQKTFDEVRRFLLGWSEKIKPLYFAASLGPEFAYPDDSLRTKVIDQAIMHLLQRYPAGKFMVTMLSRVNQHELCVLARKFGSLHVFGCWWFCNDPSIVEEMTRQRLELLGTAFTCQHSDARVLDQLIYKWAHTRKVVAEVLVGKYTDLVHAGWRPTKDEIWRDARALFGGSFAEFLAR